jgi:hypothetical protein
VTVCGIDPEEEKEEKEKEKDGGARPPTPRLLDVAAVAKKSGKGEDDGVRVFADFRRPRAAFMGAMNERLARLTRVADIVGERGIGRALEAAAAGGEIALDVLAIARMRPQALGIADAPLVIRAAARVCETDVDLAVASVEGVLQAFGKIVHATRALPARDEAVVQRKKACDAFVEAFREFAPVLRTLAGSRSPVAQTAAEMIEEWRVFLR